MDKLKRDGISDDAILEACETVEELPNPWEPSDDLIETTATHSLKFDLSAPLFDPYPFHHGPIRTTSAENLTI